MQPRVIEFEQSQLKVEFVGATHGFCNLLRRTLLEEPSVEFAGYSVDHPLLANPVFTIRTKRRHSNVVLREALEKMLARTEDFRKTFLQAASDHNIE
jgi:DNA-directed RNA polymerase subunit L